MTYLRARWYDSYLNQFVSPDSIVADYRNPQSINRYTYALGNPANLLDPSGLYPDYEKTILFYRYNIALEEDEFSFFRHEKRMILETVMDYSDLLGGAESLKRNFALSKIRIGWVTLPEQCEVGDYCPVYDPSDKSITLPLNWSMKWSYYNDFNGRDESTMNQHCLEEVEEFLSYATGTFPSSEILAQYVLAHEMTHALQTGNPDTLESFSSHVPSPMGPIGKLNENPIIRERAYDVFNDREVMAEALASYLYIPDRLNQKMLDWIEDEMQEVLL
jgi:hypothetical protein